MSFVFTMIELFIYIFIFLAVLVFSAVLLPVTFYIHASGGTEDGFELYGKKTFLYGFIGAGLLYSKNSYILKIFLFSWQVLSINIKPMMEYLSGKIKKRKVKKVKLPKKKKPLYDRIETYYHKYFTYREYFRTGLGDLWEIIRIDMFSTNIHFGLGNPYLTGKLIGIIYIINGILPHPFEIIPSWDFTNIAFQGKIAVKITFRSHIFWKKIIYRLPFIVSIIRQKRGQKEVLNHTLIIKEV